MEAFLFCLEIIRREAEKFNVAVNATPANHINAATAENVNYDIPYNRSSYLYRCGAITLSFTKNCFSKFFADYKSIVFLVSKWVNCPNLTVCSLSKGPALDYIAFLLSYQECGMFPPLFKDVKVVSKYGAWRNTVNIMHQIVTEGLLKSLPASVSLGNIEVVQGDPFQDFSQKVGDPISNSDVVIIVKRFNLQTDLSDQDKIANSLQEFLAALKPDAILFCIDTKPSITMITKEISSFNGTYLLQPTFMNTSITLEHTDFYKDIFGCFPVVSARGSFFVWQKSPVLVSPSSHLGYLMDEVSESVKRLLRINSDNSYSDNSSESNSNCEKLVSGKSHSSTSTFVEKNSNELFMLNGNVKGVTKKSENNDPLYVDSANISVQNSSNYSSSSSVPNGLLNCENEGNILSKEISPSINSFNKSSQTEPVINLQTPESVKIAALTERVVNLAATIKDLLETNELKDNGCLKHTEGKDKVSSCHSSLVSCSCNFSSGCPENYMCDSLQEKNFENNCSNHVCKQGCLACCRFNNSSVSLNSNNETARCNNTPCHKLKVSENKLVPKLVIPLSSLSENVIAQIISLISQSN